MVWAGLALLTGAGLVLALSNGTSPRAEVTAQAPEGKVDEQPVAQTQANPEVSLMSFNIRYDEPTDDPDWAARLGPILTMLSDTEPVRRICLR